MQNILNLYLQNPITKNENTKGRASNLHYIKNGQSPLQLFYKDFANLQLLHLHQRACLNGCFHVFSAEF